MASVKCTTYSALAEHLPYLECTSLLTLVYAILTFLRIACENIYFVRKEFSIQYISEAKFNILQNLKFKETV